MEELPCVKFLSSEQSRVLVGAALLFFVPLAFGPTGELPGSDLFIQAHHFTSHLLSWSFAIGLLTYNFVFRPAYVRHDLVQGSHAGDIYPPNMQPESLASGVAGTYEETFINLYKSVRLCQGTLRTHLLPSFHSPST